MNHYPRRIPTRRRDNLGPVAKLVTSLAVLAVVVAGGLGWQWVAGAGANQQTRPACTVQAKERLRTDTGGEGERRLTTSCGIFTVEDGMFSGYDSADQWAAVQVGHTYDLRTGGYRIPVLSQFPTVLDAQETSR